MWHPQPDEESPSERTDALYREHHALVATICRLLLRDRGEAEDAAQQVFLSVHRALVNGAVPREPAPWVATIARNECHARRQQRPLVLIGDDLELESSVTADPSMHVMQRAELRALWDEIAGLPPVQREALLLREICGLSYHQLAVELDVSRASARSLLSRAREQVRSRLRDVSAGVGGASWVAQLARLVEGGPVLGGPTVGAGRLAVVAVGAATLVVGTGSDAHLRGITTRAPAPHTAVRPKPPVRTAETIARRPTPTPLPLTPVRTIPIVEHRRNGGSEPMRRRHDGGDRTVTVTSSRSGPDGGSATASSSDNSGPSKIESSSDGGAPSSDGGGGGSDSRDGSDSPDGSGSSGGRD